MLYGRKRILLRCSSMFGFLSMIHPKSLSDNMVILTPESTVHGTFVLYVPLVGVMLMFTGTSSPSPSFATVRTLLKSSSLQSPSSSCSSWTSTHLMVLVLVLPSRSVYLISLVFAQFEPLPLLLRSLSSDRSGFGFFFLQK